MSTAPYLPETAPFSEEQRAWLNGFLSGLYSSAPGDAEAVTSSATPVSILFGSQTGTSESLAKKAAKQLKAANCAPKVVDMADASLEDLAAGGHVLIITSTYGEGDPPDNAMALHEELMSDAAPKMESLNYAVLGLGDSNYADFCQCSKEFDARLETLGATRIAETVECDGDPDAGFAQWLGCIQEALGNSAVAASASTEDKSDDDMGFSKKNPFAATLLKTENLNKQGSAKATHHIEISLDGSGLEYEVGDALGVYPENNSILINQIITSSGLRPHESVSLPGGGSDELSIALHIHYDVAQLTEAFLVACARLSQSEELRAIVADDLKIKAYCKGRGVIDPIEEFGIKFPTAEYFVAALKPLAPRLYSISSSPKAHPGEVHLTVGKVSYQSHGRSRAGVCSTFLADHTVTTPVKVYLHRNNAFRLPEDDQAPVIMIGPGTGIAPFRAYLEERKARGATGKNWLFFGDQHTATDFLYEDQIDAWLKSRHLTRLDTAFSRDQEQKIYVQDRILEQAEEFYAWLEEGSSIYICGDASRMAKDVDLAIHKVIERIGGKTQEEAKAYVDALKKAKRYLRDVY